jgi:PEP-CTERM motif
MKKLALASAAFAGLSAFGAGDAFATGITFYTNASSFYASPNGGGVQDSIDFGTLVGGVSGSVATSNTSGVPATFKSATEKGIGYTGSFLANTGAISRISVAFQTSSYQLGFSNGAVLLGNEAGLLKLSFTKPISALLLAVAPGTTGLGITQFEARVTAFPGGATQSVTGTYQASCGFSSGCTVLGVTDPTGISSIIIAVSDPGPPSYQPSIFDPQINDSTQGIPEPATLGLLGAGLTGLAAFRRRRRSRDPGDGSRWSPFGRWRVTGHPPDPAGS